MDNVNVCDSVLQHIAQEAQSMEMRKYYTSVVYYTNDLCVCRIEALRYIMSGGFSLVFSVSMFSMLLIWFFGKCVRN